MSAEVELKEVKTEIAPATTESASVCTDDHCHCKDEKELVRILSGEHIHDVVMHGDHYDVVMNGRLHHVNNDHFDYHGIYNPSKNKAVGGYMMSIRKLIGNTDFPEPENEKRQYNISDEDKKAFMDAKEAKIKKTKDDQCRLMSMMFLTGFFMIVEFVTGIVANALALQADAMHMASDLIALIIGYWAISLARRPESRYNTYGWSRFEVIGAMINSVFLFAVCFNIIVEALTRIIDINEVKEGMTERRMLNLVVSVLGLVINIVGLMFFGCSGEDPHGHSHAHGHHHHHHDEEECDDDHDHDHDHDHHEHEHEHEHDHHDHDHEHEHEHEHHDHDHEHDHHEHEHTDVSSEVVVDMGAETPKKPAKKGKKRSANIEAVFLHVLSDALGSVGAIASACLINFLPESQGWKYYADPVCSLFIVFLILTNSIPLFKSVLGILLQSAPKSVNMKKLSESLVKIPGVEYFHGLHVWQLNEDIFVATVHIICSQGCNHQTVMDNVKKLFHSCNIHGSTVQIEIVRNEGVKDVCNDIVCNDPNCLVHNCCAPSRIVREMSQQAPSSP